MANAQVTVTITPAATTICNGTSMHISSSPSSGSYTYQWLISYTGTFSNIPGPAGTTTPLVYTPSSTCSIKLDVTAAGITSHSLPTTINVAPVVPASTISPSTPPSACVGYTAGTALTGTTVSGASYQWYNDAGAITGATTTSYTIPTGLAAGTYHYTLQTSVGTCTATSNTSTFTVHALPVASISPTSGTYVCANAPVTLYASPTGTGDTYVWSDFSTGPTLTFTPTSLSTAYPYSVTVTDANGCSNSASTSVTTYSTVPSATVTQSCGTTFCTGGSVTLTVPTGYTTYSWTLDGSAVSSTYSYTCSSPANGSHNAVVTVTNASGCTAQSTTVITSHPCTGCAPTASSFPSCQQYTVLGETGTISGTLILTSGVYFLSSPTGTITIPGDVEISNATILVDENTTIDVQSLGTLKLAQDHLFTCSPNMWKGIVAEPNSDVELNSNFIEDAITAVRTDGTSGMATISLLGNVFNKNNTGLVINNYSTTPSLVMRDNIFTTRNFNSWPGYPFYFPYYYTLIAHSSAPAPFRSPHVLEVCGYSFTTCNNGLYSYGVTLDHNAANINIGESNISYYINLFDHMLYGVYAKNSFTTISACIFSNMQNSSAIPGGDGVYAVNDIDSPTTVNIGLAGDLYGNQFYLPNNSAPSPTYSVTAVEADNVYNLKSQGTLIIADQSLSIYSAGVVSYNNFAYEISGYNYNNVDISYDTILNITNGIDFSDENSGTTANYGSVNFSNNIFGAGASDGYINEAIIATNSSTITPTVTGAITINNNSMNNGFFNIFTTQFQQHLVTEKNNTITVYNDPLNITVEHPFGIYNESNSGDVVENNSIQGSSTAANNILAYGIWEEFANNTRLSCNATTFIGTGFEFDLCYPTLTWSDNTMMQNLQSMVIDGGGIGTQGSLKYASGNLWMGNLPTSSDTYVTGGTDPSSNSVLYVQALGYPYAPVVNNGSGSYTYNTTGALLAAVHPNPATCPLPRTYSPSLVANIIASAQTYVLSPNPGNGLIKITQAVEDANVPAQVTSIDGRIVYKGQLQFADRYATLDLQGIAPGMYMVQLQDSNGGIYNMKYVINR